MLRSVGLLACVVVAISFAAAQDAENKKAKKDKLPVLEQVKDVVGLPRVLLIGDSISMGYTLPTRDKLKGVANVHRPPVNCGPTTRGVAEIDRWLGDGKWDVIHFNFGLHDLKYVDEAGKNVAPEKGRVQVSRSDYEKNLDALVRKMKKTGARVIFALTTPVPAGEPQRQADSDKSYNATASEVMQRHRVALNDLNAFVRQNPSSGQLPKNVHFTPEGYRLLAEKVAGEIRKALAK
jgi:lysophospholipase L1-like esterase